MKRKLLLAFVGLVIVGVGQGCTRKLPYSLIDTHVHVDMESGSVDLAGLVEQLDQYDLTRVFLMQTPDPTLPTDGSKMPALLSFASAQASRFKFLFGGGDLNPIVHALGRSNAATLTLTDLFPNGGGSQAEVDKVKAVAADSATYTTQFQDNATTAATSGQYVGFGEFAPYHASRRTGHPFIEYPVNHTLMKWLANLAASNNMVIDVHVEAVGEKVNELADLLAHNRSAKIIWQHAGWSETGGATATLFESMLAAHSNLYLGIKIRGAASEEMESSSVFDERGRIKSDWLNLFKKYPDRIMVGSDMKFFQSGKSAGYGFSLVVAMNAELQAQLPKDVAKAISTGTAERLFGL